MLLNINHLGGVCGSIWLISIDKLSSIPQGYDSLSDRLTIIKPFMNFSMGFKSIDWPPS